MIYSQIFFVSIQRNERLDIEAVALSRTARIMNGGMFSKTVGSRDTLSCNPKNSTPSFSQNQKKKKPKKNNNAIPTGLWAKRRGNKKTGGNYSRFNTANDEGIRNGDDLKKWKI